ncbi:MAG: tetratricopeptide repeat protein [Anaerolineae bacterium]
MDSPDPRLTMADAFLMAGELADALEALDSYLSEQPDDGDIRRLRAAVLLRLPGDDTAWAALDDLAAMRVRTAEDEIARVRALRRLGEDTAAHEVLFDAFERTGDLRLADLLLASLHQRGEVDPALDVLEILPETTVWLRWRGEFALLADDPAAAVAAFNAALARLAAIPETDVIRNERGQLLLRRADAWQRSGDERAALHDRDEARRLLPAER